MVSALYMDAPGGARVLEGRSKGEWPARLYAACGCAWWRWPCWSGGPSGAIRATVSVWTWGVSGFLEWRSLPFALTSSSSQPVGRCSQFSVGRTALSLYNDAYSTPPADTPARAPAVPIECAHVEPLTPRRQYYSPVVAAPAPPTDSSERCV